MTRFYAGEKWKEFKVDKSLKFRYAVSNYGRLLSFVDKPKNGRILKGGDIEGYRVHSYKISTKKGIKHKTFFIHKLVATCFLKQKTDEHVFVIHLDRDRGNNSTENLKWVTKREMLDFNKKSPFVIKARKKLIAHNINSDGRKLTVAKAMEIKKYYASGCSAGCFRLHGIHYLFYQTTCICSFIQWTIDAAVGERFLLYLDSTRL